MSNEPQASLGSDSGARNGARLIHASEICLVYLYRGRYHKFWRFYAGEDCVVHWYQGEFTIKSADPKTGYDVYEDTGGNETYKALEPGSWPLVEQGPLTLLVMESL